MYGAILGDIIGSPYEFDMGNKSKEFPLCSGRAKNATLRPEKNDQFGQREIANAQGE